MSASVKITVIRSDRRTLSLRVTGPDSAEVRAPLGLPRSRIDAFLREKAGWLETKLKRMAEEAREAPPPFTEQEIRALAEQALRDLPPRAARYSGQLGVTYGRITVRNQKTRWGSCSSKGNLNFNCLLMLCPEKVRDYVVIHELCHRMEMNHSARFWAEVEKAMPDYRVWRSWLKEEGKRLIDRL